MDRGRGQEPSTHTKQRIRPDCVRRLSPPPPCEVESVHSTHFLRILGSIAASVTCREQWRLPVKVLIFGVGELAELVHFYLAESHEWDVVGFAADQQYLPTSGSVAGLPAMSIEEAIFKCPPVEHRAFVAVSAGGLNRQRESLCNRAEAAGYGLISYVHPSATVASNVEIGRNSFVFEDNTLQPFTRVGDRCVLWSGNHVGHRSVIEDDVFISSHVVISGFCRIGRYSYLGVNSTIADGVDVAQDTVLGAGALLLDDNEAGGVYVGSPAKRLPNRQSIDVQF